MNVRTFREKMKCNKDCENCIHPDCIRPDGQDEADRVREYRKRNPEKIKAYNKAYKSAHREELLLKRRERHHTVEKHNPEVMEKNRERSRLWTQAHLEEKREKDRIYQKQNAEKVNAYNRAYRARKKAEKAVGA